jgi:RNA polymerase sigma-70 factor (ECF subfamily)
MTYCVVPRDLAEKLYEPLREHFRAERSVEVVVERRRTDRRGAASRRARDPEPRAAGGERRLIRSASGRRIAERRALTAPAAVPPPLPRKAARHAAELVFLERLEPSSQAKRDADSKRLVTRYQAGDEAVFGELYLRYFNPVYTYARVALRDHHEAEDVTQQVFIRVLSALGRFQLRPNVPFRGWLFAIARNVIVDAVRQQHGLLLEPPETVEAILDHAPPGQDTAETLGWLSDREIAMFVERLPLAQRQVLVLRFMLGLSGEEIAQALGRTHMAVRKLQQRALRQLEQRLAAVGRTSSEHRRIPMRVRMKPLTVMARRRFALVDAPRRVG